MFRAIPTATVFYPSDAVSTERAVELAANTKGICFIRSSRPNVDVIYSNDEKFEVGKAKVSPLQFHTSFQSYPTIYTEECFQIVEVTAPMVQIQVHLWGIAESIKN